MTTHKKFRCTSCGTSQRRLSNLSCGELKWKTKQGERSNALDTKYTNSIFVELCEHHGIK